MAKIPKNYIPETLTKQDKQKQKKNIEKSKELYKKGQFFTRPKVKSFESKPSNHISKAKKLYNVKSIKPSKELAEKTKCAIEGLKKIVEKGIGAYYSSGSRPNQTPFSWGKARLASAITGGKSSNIDYNILEEYCKKNSLALKLAK